MVRRVAKAKDDPAEEKPKPKKKVEEETNTGWTEPTTVMVKPPEQLDLTEKELAAEQTRILSAKDPGAPHNITRYSYQLQGQQQQNAQDRPDAPKINWEVISGNYVLEATVEQMATHFELEGNLYHVEDPTGVQITQEKEAKEEAARRAAENEQMGIEGGETELHRNQFNFSERACQTAFPPLRDREVCVCERVSVSTCRWRHSRLHPSSSETPPTCATFLTPIYL